MRPLAITRLPVVPDKHFLRVFIWPSVEDLNGMTGYHDIGALCGLPDTYMSAEGEIWNRVVADLHFSVEKIGAGIFAHELQHFVQHWIDLGQVDLEDDEAAPKVAGDLTYGFWTWWHNSFTMPEK